MLSCMEMDDLPPLPAPLAMGKQIHDAHETQYHARACGDLFCTHCDYHHVQLNDGGITSELLEAWYCGEEEDSD